MNGFSSGVTYDRDTGALFVVGDGGTSVTQVTKTGQLVNTMTLGAGEFNDTEGVTYVGAGRFVLTEERLRQLVQFTYAPGTTLTRAAAQTVKLGTTVGNSAPMTRRTAASSSSRRPSRSASSRPASTSPPGPRPTARRRPRARSTCSIPRSPACRTLRRLRAGRRNPADHQPGGGADRPGRPRRPRLRLAHDRLRRRQPAAFSLPEALRVEIAPASWSVPGLQRQLGDHLPPAHRRE